MTTAFSVSLIALAVFLIWTHLRLWRTAAAAKTDRAARRFDRSQFRRRMLSSAIIGLTGMALLISPRMMNPASLSFWFYWSGVLLAVMGITLLALLDVLKTRVHFRKLHHAGMVEHLALRARLARMRSHQGNGEHRPPPGP